MKQTGNLFFSNPFFFLFLSRIWEWAGRGALDFFKVTYYDTAEYKNRQLHFAEERQLILRPAKTENKI